MFGLGKKRSKLGKWLDQRGISQTWLAKTSGVARNTVNDLCDGESEREPNARTIKKIMAAIRKIDSTVKTDDFFDM